MRSSMSFNRHIRLAAIEERLYREWCQEKGISYSLLQVLDILYQTPQGVNATFICNALVMYKQTLTGLLKELDKAGFIVTLPDKEDKRSKLIFLSKKGKSCVETLLRDIYEIEAAAFQCLTETEQTQFNTLYEKLTRGLAERMESEQE